MVDFTKFKPDELYIKRWRSVDERCVITYVQDPLREIRYYHLAGADLEIHAAVIRNRMATYDSGEIAALIEAACGQTEKIIAVYHAAASTAPQPDPAIRKFLIQLLKDPDLNVRRAAVDAVLVAPWPDLREPLEEVVIADPDANLRAFAGETLQTLQNCVWVAQPGAFDFAPLPPNPRHISPLIGVRDDWYEAAFGKRPNPPPTVPAPIYKPEFVPPNWLIELAREGDQDGVIWHRPEQIRAAASRITEFTKPNLMVLSASDVTRNQTLWELMVPVADGPVFTDRVGRTERARVFVDRVNPAELLLALAPDHPPSLWLSAGRNQASLAAIAGAYFFPGLPPTSELPFQGRLFLATAATEDDGFVGVERRLEQSSFTDMLPWGSSHPSDPYPEHVSLGRVPVAELRRCMAKATDGWPRTSIRTRYSRSIVQLIDWQNGYFADLFFRPIPPVEGTERYNSQFGTNFPPGTPVDVVGALSGLACIGPERIRPQTEAATDTYQRRGMQEIIGFLERAPSLT